MRALNLLYTALLFLVGCTAEAPPSARDYSSDVIAEQVSDVPVSSGQSDMLEGPSAASDTLEDGLFISSITPKTSGTAGGQLVVVEGNAFVQGSEVWFGARRADEVTVYSETVIHARAPAHPPGQVVLRVITPDKTEAFAPETFIFRDEMAITSISPSVGPARGGTPVVVEGSGFTADTRVLLGGRLLINHQVVDGGTVLGITPPSDAVGTGDILAFSSLTNAVAKDAFRFTQAPALEDLTPSSTLANTTIEVVLTGTALTAESTVFFGEMEAEIVYADQTGLIVNAPPQSAGLVDVRVDTIDGTTTLAESFMYIGEPTGGVELFHVMPKTGPTDGGHEVALTALGIENMVELEVKFGEKKATVVSVEPEIGRMRLLTPPGVGTVDISVTCPAGMGSLSAVYTYEDAAEIDSITPTAGSSDGGETVTIVGDGVDLAQGVFIGALPATLISSAPDTLVVQTPPGSPGPADVVVVLPDQEIIAVDAYDFVVDGPTTLYAVAPNYGAVAGNTLLHIYGTGFTPDSVVYFENQKLPSLEFISSAELQARALKADEAITVDVRVEDQGQESTLADAYTYFDPYSPYGGSWGSPIDGTVNITVLDLYTTDPIPNALVLMGTDTNTPYQGLTDDRGQITFSHPTISGPQMVTAAKAQYTAFSVVEYDAENVTVHLIPFNPPSEGGGGGGGSALPFGYVTGNVQGLGKYVIVPPQTCGYLEDKGVLAAIDGTDCMACITAEDCAQGYQCSDVAGDGTFCLRSCNSISECPPGFICGSGADGSSACVPDPGEKAAFCQTTNHTIFQPPPSPHTPIPPLDDGSRAWVEADGSYGMKTRLGELAILCFGGVIRDASSPATSFLPLALGVKRNVEPIPGEELSNQHLTLDIPLSKDVPVRLDGVPTEHVSYALGIPTPVTPETRLRVAWDFGAEGYWTAFDQVAPQADNFLVTGQPESLDGPLDGLTYYFLAQVAGGPTAESGTRASKVRVIDVNRTFEYQNGTWLTTDSGVRRDIHSIWAVDASDVWAVGADGLIAHSIDGYWFSQPTPTSSTLNGVWGLQWDRVYAVGESGEALFFDGVVWNPEDTPTEQSLYAIWGASESLLYAVGNGTVLSRTSGIWSQVAGAPATRLYDIWGPSAGEFYAAGANGQLYHYKQGWTESIPLGVDDGIALQAVSGTGPDDVWVVGTQGAVFHYNGIDWQRIAVPTLTSLYDVHASENGEVFAVGARGTLISFDGNGWSLQPSPKNSGDLRSVWRFYDLDQGAVAAGVQAVTLGPMLQFPLIQEPTSVGGAFTWSLNWTAKGGPPSTFNFVEMLFAGNFPAWWTVVEAETQDITFPNLIEAGVSPFPGAGMNMKVHRVLKPGATVDNFDFWDTYDQESWQSWAHDSVGFNPFVSF